MTLTEIQEALAFTNPESLERWEQIHRDTAIYTVALLAIHNSPSGEDLSLAGSGTLLAIDESFYIPTAAHVWHMALKNVHKLGVDFRGNLNHKHLIDIDFLAPVEPPRPNTWSEWGPDVILLKIPTVDARTIQAFHKVFYRIPPGGEEEPTQSCCEYEILIGTPIALGKIAKSNADLTTCSFSVLVRAEYETGGLDYIDVEAKMPSGCQAGTFGGVSGGGLWTVRIYSEEGSNQLRSEAVLKGVAFWETNVAGGQGIIRCHGHKSIQSVVQRLMQ